MALSKTSVEQGIAILKQINPRATTIKYETYDLKGDYSSVDHIHCIDEKADGGFANVFINIENMSDEQRKLWEALKRDIPNTDITSSEEPNITCIGWY